MAKTENQTVMKGRDKLMSRASQRFPDRTFMAANGENGENIDDLDEAINEMMDEQDGKINEMNDILSKLQSLMYEDPQFAEFISTWLETGDPRAALVEVFGDELAELATEAGRKKFSSNLESWRKRKKENDELTAKYNDNWNSMLERVESWGNAKGLSTEQKANVIMRLIDVYDKGLTNAYDESDFDMALKALNYDKDVVVAREEGEVAGRNARIQTQRRARTPQDNIPPSGSGSKGMHIPAPAPPVKRSIWDEV